MTTTATTERPRSRQPLHADTDVTPAQLARAGANYGRTTYALTRAAEAANNLIHDHAIPTHVSPQTHDRLREAARQLRQAIADAEQEAQETYDLTLASL